MAKTRYNKLNRKLEFGTNKRYREQDIRDARAWFRDQIKLLRTDKKKYKMSDLRTKTALPKSLLGSMLFYKYNPKHKLTLPYYDIFPLIILIGEYQDGWLGLNLHYLPPNMRAAFLGKLMYTLNNTSFNKTTQFKATYNLLKNSTKFRFFKPCVKRYLNNHVQSKVQVIRPEQWHRAIFLPVAKFQKASEEHVWKESKRIINE